MKKRVLIISASAGTGHVRAGQALEKAFAADPRVGEVIHEDALKYTNTLFREFYSTLYTKLVTAAPQLLGWFYRTSDEPWKNENVRSQFDRLNTRPLVKFIQDFDPHITVCTHFMPAGIISHLIEKEELNAHLSIVVTDLDCHAMWLARLFHRYFVAGDEARAHLEALGLPSERITVSGIPIDPIFGQPIDRAAVRRQFGLDPEKTTLLLSAGALGVSPTESVVARLKELRHDVQTIVVCGRNEEVQQGVTKTRRRRQSAISRARLFRPHARADADQRSLHWQTGRADDLRSARLRAADGDLFADPGQEERNSDHLLEDGVAIKCNELTTIPFKIDRLLDQPEKLEAMRRAARAFGGQMPPHGRGDFARRSPAATRAR
jgi:processive 1,2-diacylglycerol beta-glucosyltransferase